MPRRCCLPGCKNNYTKKGPYTNVFSFPKNGPKRTRWLNAIGIPNFSPTLNQVVCIKHFEEKFINRKHLQIRLSDGGYVCNRVRLVLAEDAIPTIFPVTCMDEEQMAVPSSSSVNTKKAEENKTTVSCPRTGKKRKAAIKSEEVWRDFYNLNTLKNRDQKVGINPEANGSAENSNGTKTSVLSRRKSEVNGGHFHKKFGYVTTSIDDPQPSTSNTEVVTNDESAKQSDGIQKSTASSDAVNQNIGDAVSVKIEESTTTDNETKENKNSKKEGAVQSPLTACKDTFIGHLNLRKKQSLVYSPPQKLPRKRTSALRSIYTWREFLNIQNEEGVVYNDIPENSAKTPGPPNKKKKKVDSKLKNPVMPSGVSVSNPILTSANNGIAAHNGTPSSPKKVNIPESSYNANETQNNANKEKISNIVNEYLESKVMPVPKTESPIKKPGSPIKKPGSPIKKPGSPIKKLGRPVKKLGRPVKKLGRPLKNPESPIKKLGRPPKNPESSIKNPESPIKKLGRPLKNPESSIKNPESAVKKLGRPIKKSESLINETKKDVSFLIEKHAWKPKSLMETPDKKSPPRGVFISTPIKMNIPVTECNGLSAPWLPKKVNMLDSNSCKEIAVPYGIDIRKVGPSIDIPVKNIAGLLNHRYAGKQTTAADKGKQITIVTDWSKLSIATGKQIAATGSDMGIQVVTSDPGKKEIGKQNTVVTNAKNVESNAKKLGTRVISPNNAGYNKDVVKNVIQNAVVNKKISPQIDANNIGIQVEPPAPKNTIDNDNNQNINVVNPRSRRITAAKSMLNWRMALDCL